MSSGSHEVAYLREKAKRFRKLASEYQSHISAKLLEIAEELEKYADELERRGGR